MSQPAGFYNVSINPRRLCVYWEPEDRKRRYSKGYHSQKMPKSINTGGIISLKAQKRINNTIDWMLAQSKPKKYYSKEYKKHFWFRINFLTLSLPSPQIHSDNKIKKQFLNNFLVQLRTKWGVKYYMWRAEPQINNNIHFHICCDKYIPWWEIRATWNKIINNLGYVDRYTKKHINMSLEDYLEENPPNKKHSYYNRQRAYKLGCENGWSDPNSTDIHKVKKIKNLGGYLSKEIAKNSKGFLYTPIIFSNGKFKPCYNPSFIEEIHDNKNKLYRIIEGNLWNLSEKLSKIKAAVLVVDGIVRKELELIKDFFKQNVFSGDYYEVVNIPVNTWANVIKGVLWDAYQNNLQLIRTGYIQNKISFN